MNWPHPKHVSRCGASVTSRSAGGRLVCRPIRYPSPVSAAAPPCLAQLLLQCWRHGRWGAMRRRVPAIVHARRALGVVALGELADPVGRIPGHSCDLHGGVPLAEQPEDLPPAALIGFFGRPQAALELIDAQVGLEVNTSGHAPILQPPSSKPYEYVWPSSYSTTTKFKTV